MHKMQNIEASGYNEQGVILDLPLCLPELFLTTASSASFYNCFAFVKCLISPVSAINPDTVFICFDTRSPPYYLKKMLIIRYIQKLLGHSSITTTQIYTYVAMSKQKEILSAKHPRNKIKVKAE